MSIEVGPMEQQVCVTRPQADGVGHVLNGCRRTVQLEQSKSAIVVCVHVLGILLDPRTVPFDEDFRTV